MKTILNKILVGLPFVGRLIDMIDAHSAEISNIRAFVDSEIELIREKHAAELDHLRDQVSAQSAAMSAFTTALTENVTMRTNAQLVEVERLSHLYESIALRLSVQGSSQVEPPLPRPASRKSLDTTL